MKKKQFDEVDEFIFEKLKDLDIPYKEQSWNDLEKQIIKQKRTLITKIIAAAAIIVIGIFLLLKICNW